MATQLAQLFRGAYCTHGPGEHQVIEGSMSTVSPSDAQAAAIWPAKLCDLIGGCGGVLEEPDGASSVNIMVFGGRDRRQLPGSRSREQCLSPGGSSSSADEPERLTGERYYVTFDAQRLDGYEQWWPTSMSHLSNDRLARMFILRGAQNNGGAGAEVAMSSLRRGRAGVTPQVAYHKPKKFNERTSATLSTRRLFLHLKL